MLSPQGCSFKRRNPEPALLPKRMEQTRFLAWWPFALCVAGIFWVQNPSETIKIVFLSPTIEPYLLDFTKSYDTVTYDLLFSYFLTEEIYACLVAHARLKKLSPKGFHQIVLCLNLPQVCTDISYGVMCSWAACLLASRSSWLCWLWMLQSPSKT